MITSITDTNLVSSDSSITETNSVQDLGQDAFLTLLVAQLQNQDPLNPLEGQEFSAQLAQFSSLEQLFAVNEALAGIQKSLETNQKENALDYIGKMAKINDDWLSVQEGEVDSGTYVLDSDANVDIEIINSQGETVRIIYAGWQEAGEYSLDWDGLDDNGDQLEDGDYMFQINAVDSEDYTVSADTFSIGEINGITYDNDIAYLIMGNKTVSLEDVVEIKNQI